MKSSELLKLLRNDGWYKIRQSGSHVIMKHNIKSNLISVPYHPSKEVKKGTLLNILKKAEINTSKR